MKRTTPQHLTISLIILLAIVTSLVSPQTAPSFTPQCPLQIMPSRATRGTQEAARRRQEDKAMAAAILQKEKDATKHDGLKRRMKITLTWRSIRTRLMCLYLRLSLLPLCPISPLFSPATLARKCGCRLLTMALQRIRAATHRRTNRSMTM